MGHFVKKVSCPACGSRDNVGVYLDGNVYNGRCFGCGTVHRDIKIDSPDFDSRQWDVPIPETTQEEIKQKETVEQVNSYPVSAIPGRWELEDAILYGIKCSFDSFGNPEAIYYPLHRDGKVVRYKKRVLATKQFSVIGGPLNRVDSIGLQMCPQGGPCLIVTEGEDDIGAARKMFRAFGKNYLVTSVPSGATVDDDTGEGILDKPLKKMLSQYSNFDVVYLCLDQDAPGRALCSALAEELAVYTEVRFMSFSLKDAREMENEGRYTEFWNAFNGAIRYTPDSIIRSEDVSLESLMRPLREGLPLPIPELQAAMHGLRHGDGGGELTLLTGGSGVGKTTLARAIANHIVLNTNIKVCNIFLEEQFSKTMQAVVAAYWEVPLPVLRANPNILTREQWMEAKERMLDGRQVFQNHFGSISSDKLMNRFHYAHTREGADLIILDHISMVVAGQDVGVGGERKDIDKLMHNLASFVTVTGCHVVAIVHLKRGDRRIFKDKEGNIDLDIAPYDKGGVIGKEDLRGSGGLEQMAHNIIALEGNVYGSDERFHKNDRWLRLLKCREWNNVGLAGMYEVDDKTGVIKPKRNTR